MNRWLRRFFGPGSLSDEQYRRERGRILETAPIPVLWLFGKTGSGKSSVIRYLTSLPEIEIGPGFRPQTLTSRQFDFPSPEQPVLRFLDTRGLGERSYDPAEDIRRFNDMAHVMIVTVRVMDHAVEEVVRSLGQFRRARPHRPVLLALTCLHEAYPGVQHPSPDPFNGGAPEGGVLEGLRRSIEQQTQRFAGLVDRTVPIDLTKPEDGFEQPDFGGGRLKAAILESLPAAYRQTFMNLDAAVHPLKNLNDRRAMSFVIGYSTLAATAAGIPTPWIDIPLVLAIQSHLVYRLRDVYGQQVDAPVLRRLCVAAGGRVFARLLVREALKFVPLAGAAANAAFAYAYTYGLGKAFCWYFGQVRAGNAPTEEEVKRVWREQLSIAARRWLPSASQEAGVPAASAPPPAPPFPAEPTAEPRT